MATLVFPRPAASASMPFTPLMKSEAQYSSALFWCSNLERGGEHAGWTPGDACALLPPLNYQHKNLGLWRQGGGQLAVEARQELPERHAPEAGVLLAVDPGLAAARCALQ